VHDLTFTHIGGPTLLVESAGVRILTDPTFDPPGEYPLPGRTLVKRVAPAIPIKALPPIDIVLLSHDHHKDNLDEAGRALLPHAGIVVTTRSGAQRLGGNAVGLEPFQRHAIDVRGHKIEVVATPARHGPPGSEPIVGDVIGFLVSIDSQPLLYISGDTVLYEGLDDIKNYGTPVVGILHMGRASTRGMLLTMGAAEAASLARELRLKHVVPVHYEGWAHFTEPVDDAKAAFSESAFDGEVHWLTHGKRESISYAPE
jgi:L-ascorbate metabolism protein UlaG (beta-lactamase superfamily)